MAVATALFLKRGRRKMLGAVKNLGPRGAVKSSKTSKRGREKIQMIDERRITLNSVDD